MLQFIETEKHYIIKETLLSFIDTKTTMIYYSKDLMHKNCDAEPIRETTEQDRNWFKKYYMHKFKK